MVDQDILALAESVVRQEGAAVVDWRFSCQPISLGRFACCWNAGDM